MRLVLLLDDLLDELAHAAQLLGEPDQRDHDLGARIATLGLQLVRGAHDRAGLHPIDLGEQEAEAAAAGAEHRVRLGQFLDAREQELCLAEVALIAVLLDALDGARRFEQRRQELVERRVEQADGDRQAIHRLENADEVALLHRTNLVERDLALRIVVGEDHLAHDRQASLAHEHVLSTAEADALGTETAGAGGVLRRIGVGTHAQAADVIGPRGDALEVLVEARRHEGHRTAEDLAGRAVHRESLALFDGAPTDDHAAALDIDLETLDARHARLAHAARNHGRVRRHAAVRGDDALRHDHPVDVVGRGLPAHEDHRCAGLATALGRVGIEHDLANAGTRRGVETAGEQVAWRVGVDRRVQQLVELLGVDALDRLLLGDDALINHVARHADGGLRGALAVARLQQVELALLDRELDVLHVAVVRLQARHGGEQLGVGLGQLALELGQRPRRTDAGDDVLTLGIHEELAVQLLGARRGIAREAHARGRRLAQIAEHHLHNVHGRAEVVGDIVGTTVDGGARVLPRVEDGVDGEAQLVARVVAEGIGAGSLRDDRLERRHELLQVLGSQISVVLHATRLLQLRQRVLEVVGRHAKHHLAEHLHEAAVGVPGEAGIAALGGEALDRGVVDAEVEDRVHHARHREHRAGAHADEQRLLRIAELAAGALLECGEALEHALPEPVRPGAAGVHRINAGLGRDGEAVGNGHADALHLGNVGALAAEQVAHLGRTLGLVVDELLHSGVTPRRSLP